MTSSHRIASHLISSHGMAWHGMAWHGMAWHGMAWHHISHRASADMLPAPHVCLMTARALSDIARAIPDMA
eukprot:410575-Rhodomonas_salina.1